MEHVESIPEELATALSEYAAMQRQHSDLLAEGRLKTLPEWAARREQAFLRLQQSIARFDAAKLDGKSEWAVRLKKMMEVIMNDEHSLRMQVKRKLSEIRDTLQTLRRGKTVLKGYSLNHGAGAKPKFLSSKA